MNWTWCRVKTLSAGVVVGVAAVVSLGCSGLASGNDSLQQTLPDPHWDCLGGPPTPLPTPATPPEFVIYGFPVWDFTHTLTPVPKLTVQVCLVGDYDCTMPAGKVIGPMTMPISVQGSQVMAPVYGAVVQYQTPAYIRLTAPGYLQTEYYLGGKLIGGRTDETLMGFPLVSGLPITPITESDANNFGSAIGQRRVPGDAIVAVRTIDCQGNLAAGVTLNLSIPAPAFSYLSGQPLSTMPAQPTDAGGLAGFANIALPTPFVNVSVDGVAPVGENGTEYGKVNITIRGDQVTGGEVRPDTGLYGR